jgi:hypothetical protein
MSSPKFMFIVSLAHSSVLRNNFAELQYRRPGPRFLLAVITILIASHVSKGCECEIPAICQAFSRAELVFVGKLIKIEEAPPTTGVEQVYADFDVSESFKGSPSKIQRVEFLLGTCFDRPQVGENYFVYKNSNTRLEYYCDRTRKVDTAQTDLAYARSLAKAPPQFIINGVVNGLSTSEVRKTRIFVIYKLKSSPVKIMEDGSFHYSGKKEGKYEVRIYFPTKFIFTVKSSHGEMEIFAESTSYTLDFKANECDFRRFVKRQ